MIVVLERDLDGLPGLVECSLCKSKGIRPDIDLAGGWPQGWATSHLCVLSEVHHRRPTRL
jgi:hypothetical protein